MARKLALPSTPFAVGTITRTLDGFTTATMSRLDWSATVEPSWPSAPGILLAQFTIQWDGGGMVQIPLISGPRGPNGQPATVRKGSIFPDYESDGVGGMVKSVHTGATITMQTFVPFTTALTAEVIA